MGSRLARDQRGNLIAIVTTPERDQPVGMRFRVLGNQIECAGTEISFVGTTNGRPPDLIERLKRTTGQVPTCWPNDVPARARELHAQGLSCPKVAETLGVPFATCKSWLWPAGYETRKRKRREARAAA